MFSYDTYMVSIICYFLCETDRDEHKFQTNLLDSKWNHFEILLHSITKTACKTLRQNRFSHFILPQYFIQYSLVQTRNWQNSTNLCNILIPKLINKKTKMTTEVRTIFHSLKKHVLCEHIYFAQ